MSADVSVDSTPVFPVSSMIFSLHMEHFHREIYGGIFDPGSHLSDSRGFRCDVLEALRALRPPAVRWPGGSFASGYDWKDGVGPREPTFDRAWRVVEPNTFGTDEFIEWTRELGAEPYICTNAGTGTINDMTQWLEYCNTMDGTKWSSRRVSNGHAEPYGVQYWGLGNENYEEWELGADDPAPWARKVAEAAKAMRRVDPSVKLLAATSGSPAWTTPLLAQAGKYLDFISVHRYWDALADVNEPSDYMRCMGWTLEPERVIHQLAGMLEGAGMDHISIAFDEWNLRGWHHPEGNSETAIGARGLNDDNATYTMADALFSATFLNACIRRSDRVKMANIAPAVNARGPLYVHPDGIVKRTTYHVLHMYGNQLGGHVLPVTTRADSMTAQGIAFPVVDVAATADPETGRIVVTLVNKSPDLATEVRLKVDGVPLTGAHQLSVLSGDSPDAFNGVDSPGRVTPTTCTTNFVDGRVSLAPHSLTFLETMCPGEPGPTRAWVSSPHRGWRHQP